MLTNLNCSFNNLTNLGILPKNLIILYCSSNKLTSLNDLPQRLENIDCSDNQINPNTLGKIPYSLKNITMSIFNNYR